MANKQGIIPGHKQLHCAMRHTEEGILFQQGFKMLQCSMPLQITERKMRSLPTDQPGKQAKSGPVILVYMQEIAQLIFSLNFTNPRSRSFPTEAFFAESVSNQSSILFWRHSPLTSLKSGNFEIELPGPGTRLEKPEKVMSMSSGFASQLILHLFSARIRG